MTSGEAETEVVSGGSGAYGPCAREETVGTGLTNRVACLLDDGSPYAEKTFTPVGERRYLRITVRDHAVAQKGGKVLVHRAVLYDALKAEFGAGPYVCDWCGWADLDWFVDRADPAYLTVDHKDGNSANNRRSNLSATHKWCNDNRYIIESKGLSWDQFKATPPGKRPALRNTFYGDATDTARDLAKRSPRPAVEGVGPPPGPLPSEPTPRHLLPIRKGLVRWEDLIR